MLGQSKKSQMLVIALAAFVSSCKADLGDGDTFTGGFSHRKSTGGSSLNSNPKGGNKVIVKGRYLVRVSAFRPVTESDQSQVPTLEGLEAASKGSICVGRVFLNIKEDFSLEFPDSKIKCVMIGELDLGELLGGMNDDVDREKAAEASDKMLRLKQLGPMSFDPPRPLLVGPIIQDPSEYQGLTETKTYKVKYKDKEKGTVIEDSGDITVNVLEAGASLTPIFMPNSPFENIIKFEMRTAPNGFKKVPKTSGFLFDRVEFTVNSRPISIPVIKLESKASDLMAAGGSKKGGPAPGLASSPLVKLFGNFVPLYIRLDAVGFDTN
jgi:hypothetical protein